MRVICYGDSNTFGYDPRGYLGGRYEQNWTDFLADKTGWIVCTFGENGRSVPNLATENINHADLLIIMLGTNDLLQGSSPEEVAFKMERFIQQLHLQREKLLLIAPPPMVRGEWVETQHLIDASVSLAAHYKMLSERLGIHFADTRNWDIPLAFDGVHFTEKVTVSSQASLMLL